MKEGNDKATQGHDRGTTNTDKSLNRKEKKKMTGEGCVPGQALLAGGLQYLHALQHCTGKLKLPGSNNFASDAA